MDKRRFVIECIDHQTGSIKYDEFFEFDDELKLCEIISPGDGKILNNQIYDISEEEMIELRERLGISFRCEGKMERGDRLILRGARDLDELPYKVHTNRELILMLQGEKPLSTFSESYPNTAGVELIPESFFDPHVAEGRLVKREYIDIMYPRRSRIVLYAKKSEAWRIDANILLRQTAADFGWNETFEIFEGALLGYEPWQTKIYIEKIYRPRAVKS